MNGGWFGGRPIFAFLPHWIKNATVIESGDLKPVMTHNFLMVPQPADGSHAYRVVFKSEGGW